MGKYPILLKSKTETCVYFTFKSNGKKADMGIISVALKQSYRNKVTFSFYQDDCGTISICFTGREENIAKMEAFYTKRKRITRTKILKFFRKDKNT